MDAAKDAHSGKEQQIVVAPREEAVTVVGKEGLSAGPIFMPGVVNDAARAACTSVVVASEQVAGAGPSQVAVH